MKANATVMDGLSREIIWGAWTETIGSKTVALREVSLEIAEAQAEISFKAGYNQALIDHNLDTTTSVMVK